MALRDIPRAPLIALGVFLLMAVPSFAEFYTDWLWFGEVGYRPVFLKSLTARSAMGSTVFVVAGAFLAFNLFVALSAVPLRNIVVVTPEGPRTISLQPRRLRPVVWLVSGLLALLLAGYASSGWSSYLAYTQAVPFGQVDPVLGHDVSFYLFQWPFLSLVQRLFFSIALLSVIATAAAYALAGNLGLRMGRGVFITESTRRHLSLLLGLLLLALALGDWLEIPQQLFEPSGIITGPSYTDVHARIPALRLLAGVGVRRRAAGGGAGLQRAAVADRARASAATSRCRSAAPSTRRRSSASTSRPTSRCARRRSSSTTSRPRAPRSGSIRSRSASCRAT